MILDLNDEETRSLLGLIDAGVRATGLRSAKDAAHLIEKIEAAQREQKIAGDDNGNSN